MKRLLDLENADKQLKEATMRYDTIKLHVDHLDKEIVQLNVIEFQIEQNLSVLKSSTTIAVASEYKRSKDDLEKTRNRLVFLRIDKSNHTKMLEKAEKILIECKERYVWAMNMPVGKVIQGKFGRDDGQS